MWLRMINTILGIWLMAAPAILSYSSPAQTTCGPAGTAAGSSQRCPVPGIVMMPAMSQAAPTLLTVA